jgi:hypothetical protein
MMIPITKSIITTAAIWEKRDRYRGAIGLVENPMNEQQRIKTGNDENVKIKT